MEEAEKDSHVGRVIGDFTVISKAPPTGGKYELYICRCNKCGTEVHFGKPRIEKEGASYQCRKCRSAGRKADHVVTSPPAAMPVQDPGERFVEIMTAIGHLAAEAHEIGRQLNSRKRAIARNRAVLLAIAQVFEKADKMDAHLAGEGNEAENEG